jgi:hypothetical protein
VTSIYVQAYRRFLKAHRIARHGRTLLAHGYEEAGGEAMSRAIELYDVLNERPELLAPCTAFRIEMRQLGWARQMGASGWIHRFKARRIAKRLELLPLP